MPHAVFAVHNMVKGLVGMDLKGNLSSNSNDICKDVF